MKIFLINQFARVLLQKQSQDQMLMMPPPYKSPPMNAQPPPQQQIMSSPTTHQINQSPHYGVPTENGTTSEDSDGKSNQIRFLECEHQ